MTKTALHWVLTKGSRPRGLNKTDVTLPMTTQSLTFLRAKLYIKSDVYHLCTWPIYLGTSIHYVVSRYICRLILQVLHVILFEERTKYRINRVFQKCVRRGLLKKVNIFYFHIVYLLYSSYSGTATLNMTTNFWNTLYSNPMQEAK